jgi:hypothetical protein
LNITELFKFSEKRQKELEDAIKVKKSIAPIPHIGGNKPKEDATKLKNPKNVVANLSNNSGEQRQEHKIVKAKEKVKLYFNNQFNLLYFRLAHLKNAELHWQAEKKEN